MTRRVMTTFLSGPDKYAPFIIFAFIIAVVLIQLGLNSFTDDKRYIIKRENHTPAHTDRYRISDGCVSFVYNRPTTYCGDYTVVDRGVR